jgi:hypothetical protein
MFYILAPARNGAECWLLTTEAKSEADCVRAINWQRRGGFDDAFQLVTFNRERGAFIGPDGAEYHPDRGAYTPQAWAAFLARVGAANP